MTPKTFPQPSHPPPYIHIKLLLSFLFLLSTIATIIHLSNFNSSPPPPLHLTPTPIPDSDSDSGSILTKRTFTPIGSAAYLFIQMGAYRTGPAGFAVVGLASKPLHLFSNPQFRCHWLPHSANQSSLTSTPHKILPDWGYGRVYTVVVLHCNFPAPVGLDNSSGGILSITATSGDKPHDQKFQFTALQELPGALNDTAFSSPPKYHYLYCGSSLYGDLSPQRMREWIAYHAKLFGPKAHFVFHDAGGVHSGVLEVLRPWIESGVVSVQDVREQERFDGYYHNQFLVVNDCLFRYRFDAQWIFFFDVDEFVYLRPGLTMDSVVGSLSNYSQFTIEQVPMSSWICRRSDYGKKNRMWGIEKLVYRDVKKVARRDRKYAIQPKYAYATGVHMSQNVAGQTLHRLDGRIKYFHYHGSIATRREPCKVFFNTTEVTYEGTPYVLDETLRRIAGPIKRFEFKKIGTRLARTLQ